MVVGRPPPPMPLPPLRLARSCSTTSSRLVAQITWPGQPRAAIDARDRRAFGRGHHRRDRRGAGLRPRARAARRTAPGRWRCRRARRSARPAMAPAGPNSACRRRRRRLERTRAAISLVTPGKPERISQPPAPPRRDGDLGDRGAVMRVHHQVRRGDDGRVLGRQIGAPAEQQHVAGAKRVAVDRDEMARGGIRQRLAATPPPPSPARKAARVPAPRRSPRARRRAPGRGNRSRRP